MKRMEKDLQRKKKKKKKLTMNKVSKKSGYLLV